MNPRLDDTLRAWLRAEQAGEDAAAERALARAFAALPLPAPRRGFAVSVVARVGLPALPAAYSAPARAAIAACLLLVGSALAYTLPLAFGVSRLFSPGDVVSAMVGGFVGLASRLDELLGLWRFFAGLADTLLAVATSPPVALAVLGLTALSALTLRGLGALLFAKGSSTYVQAI